MRSILTNPNSIICEGQDQLAALRRITTATSPNKRPSPQPTALSPSAPTLHSATTMAAAVALSSVAPLQPLARLVTDWPSLIGSTSGRTCLPGLAAVLHKTDTLPRGERSLARLPL